jgi:DtxR family Mn-dependent transcriptional regulator
MLPSQTVENYLKTIYLAQVTIGTPGELVPMGQLAASLRVVPGTATTMVKTLAESGLVRYEPYMGVRLTDAGERLASRVLRRHRLVELFLVRILGMSWADVHDEAERLEHAVSDKLIDRIDDMLGHPDVDPHGDPIPTAEGMLATPSYHDLLDAPLGTPLVIARVADQDADFLRFIEQRQLVPGAEIVIEERDPTADAVLVRSIGSGDATTIGTRAASKLLVKM